MSIAAAVRRLLPTRGVATSPSGLPSRRRGVSKAWIGLLLVSGLAAEHWADVPAAEPVVPAGYRLELIGQGFQFPQDLAFDPPESIWVLTQGDRAGHAAGRLTRVSLAGPVPADAAQLWTISVPFSPDPAHFRLGSLARHPTTGDLYVAESRGRHIFRVTPRGETTLYARGLNLLPESRGLAFDAQGRLIVVDFVGRAAITDVARGDFRELFGDRDGYHGPVIYRLRVDEPLPLPRNLEYAPPMFPRAAFRRTGTTLSAYVSVLALPDGDVILTGASGQIARLHADGTVIPLVTVPRTRIIGAGRDGILYALDFLAGRIARVFPHGTVEPCIEGLSRPAAAVVLPDDRIVVVEDTGRLLTAQPGPAPRVHP